LTAKASIGYAWPIILRRCYSRSSDRRSLSMGYVPLLQALPELHAIEQGLWAVGYGNGVANRLYVVRATKGFRGLFRGIYGDVFEVIVFFGCKLQSKPIKFHEFDSARRWIVGQDNHYRTGFEQDLGGSAAHVGHSFAWEIKAGDLIYELELCTCLDAGTVRRVMQGREEGYLYLVAQQVAKAHIL
jgi:hypothetical protein